MPHACIEHDYRFDVYYSVDVKRFSLWLAKPALGSMLSLYKSEVAYIVAEKEILGEAYSGLQATHLLKGP